MCWPWVVQAALTRSGVVSRGRRGGRRWPRTRGRRGWSIAGGFNKRWCSRSSDTRLGRRGARGGDACRRLDHRRSVWAPEQATSTRISTPARLPLVAHGARWAMSRQGRRPRRPSSAFGQRDV